MIFEWIGGDRRRMDAKKAFGTEGLTPADCSRTAVLRVVRFSGFMRILSNNGKARDGCIPRSIFCLLTESASMYPEIPLKYRPPG